MNYHSQRHRPVPSLWLVVLLGISFPLAVQAVEVDLTRYLARVEGGNTALAETFFGVPGPARLIIEGADGRAVALLLNGETVVTAGQAAGDEVEVELVEVNAITIAANSTSGPVSVRVKQRAEVELNVISRVHFNTNVSNFVKAQEFYHGLGLETMSGFPDTNTQAMARAIGIETPTSYDGSQGDWAGGYLLHGEIVGLGFFGGVIDLIEFTIPRNDDPPYTRLNHLGMARAAMHTTDIQADYQTLKEKGVEFLSAPVTRSDGSTFCIFKDLDGTFYELIEVEGEADEERPTHIVQIGHVNVNVSDYERSRAWYQMLGFEASRELPRTESADVARAMGFDVPFEVRGALVTHESDGSALELVQWLDPYDPEPPYPVPVNHFGIHRMAFSTSDIEADVAALKAQGVEFISPVTPCCSGPDAWGSIVAFYDPDGTVVELVETPGMGQIMSVILWFRDLFD